MTSHWPSGRGRDIRSEISCIVGNDGPVSWQIEAAPSKSHKAKLVSLADKLHNLRDLDAHPPSSWPHQRTQHYFTWAAQVYTHLHLHIWPPPPLTGGAWPQGH